MSRRIPYSAKGKEIVREFSPPPIRRIRAPSLDNSDLILENSLTLIGRLTNPSVQRLWSLIPFLSNRWNLKGKAIGSDLGRGCFQFRFDFEEDLQKVLDNRPYHFDDWMVILQKWEPVIDASFPSQIPFWIEVQGLPLHYWKPAMLINIGEALGDLIEHELTPAAARLRVMINGLQPLIKETIVDFSDGSEALVNLEYKRLKNHCNHCNRLSHAEKECPGLQNRPEQRRDTSLNPHASSTQKGNQSLSRTHQPSSVRQKNSYNSKSLTPRSARDDRRQPSHYPEREPYSNRNGNPRRSSSQSTGYIRGDSNRHWRDTQGQKTRSNSGHLSSSYQWRAKSPLKTTPRMEESESSRPRRPPLERNIELSPQHLPLQIIPTNDEVMGDLREVTIQYMNCADPSESAARRQRVIQSEEKGMMAETAALIISAASQSTPAEAYINLNHDVSHQDPTVDQGKKKRGRPPINRTLNKSPLKLKGAKSSKRNLCLMQQSPKRKALQPDKSRAKEIAGTTNQSLSQTRRQESQQQGDVASTSRAPPKTKLIPAIRKDRVDFHNPPKPLP